MPLLTCQEAKLWIETLRKDAVLFRRGLDELMESGIGIDELESQGQEIQQRADMLREQLTSVSYDDAQDVLGDRFIGFDVAQDIFLADLPQSDWIRIPYSASEIMEAKEKGKVLVYFPGLNTIGGEIRPSNMFHSMKEYWESAPAIVHASSAFTFFDLDAQYEKLRDRAVIIERSRERIEMPLREGWAMVEYIDHVEQWRAAPTFTEQLYALIVSDDIFEAMTDTGTFVVSDTIADMSVGLCSLSLEKTGEKSAELEIYPLDKSKPHKQFHVTIRPSIKAV